jgi:cob(I)alamin adenosyltransferase
MYGRRVVKHDAHVEALGSVDELSAALGLVRASPNAGAFRQPVFTIQHDLILLMGELAVVKEDLPVHEGSARITPAHTGAIDAWIRSLESTAKPMTGWAIPGENPLAAAFDLARTVCRRAERRVSALQESGGVLNAEILVYLNRLGDLLWLMARAAERNDGTSLTS